jgi:hypothetical protein
MATAIRGAGNAARENPRRLEETVLGEELPFDFFIRLNIPRPCGNGYFPLDC